MEMTSVNYATVSFMLAEHTQNQFAKVTFAKRQKIISQMNII
nr:MAG TPA_asm: hypothetical protein [Caudoviricetes sp.]